MFYSDLFRKKSKRNPTQQEQADGTKQNNAGGYSFTIDRWKQLERFLILGSMQGTYYVGAKQLTKENAQIVIECLELDGKLVVDYILAMVQSGRAPKPDPALFALALCASLGNEQVRSYALQNLANVAKTSTHLFTFVENVQALRGWGRALKRAVAQWYNQQSVDALLYQVTKYKQRNGWSHRDLLRLSHPQASSADHALVYDWICARNNAERKSPALHRFELLGVIEKLHDSISEQEAYQLIKKYTLAREVLPSELLNSPLIWKALLDDMPATALLRNLGKMTNLGILQDFSQEQATAIQKLHTLTQGKQTSLHPLSILMALNTYGSGHGVLGDLAWQPQSKILEALEAAFYASFSQVQPTGKKIMLAVDVSGSMFGASIANTCLSAGEAAAALAMMHKQIEPECIIKAFSTEFIDLPITKSMNLKQTIGMMRQIAFGGTDCAQPMLYACAYKIPVDTFIIITDNETWAGAVHPAQALQQYRKAMGIPAKLVVCAMTATQFSIADPLDAGMLDIVGFDSSIPDLIKDFIQK